MALIFVRCLSFMAGLLAFIPLVGAQLPVDNCFRCQGRGNEAARLQCEYTCLPRQPSGNSRLLGELVTNRLRAQQKAFGESQLRLDFGGTHDRKAYKSAYYVTSKLDRTRQFLVGFVRTDKLWLRKRSETAVADSLFSNDKVELRPDEGGWRLELIGLGVKDFDWAKVNRVSVYVDEQLIGTFDWDIRMAYERRMTFILTKDQWDRIGASSQMEVVVSRRNGETTRATVDLAGVDSAMKVLEIKHAAMFMK